MILLRFLSVMKIVGDRVHGIGYHYNNSEKPSRTLAHSLAAGIGMERSAGFLSLDFSEASTVSIAFMDIMESVDIGSASVA